MRDNGDVQVFNNGVGRTEIARLSLLLAILASGAQCSCEGSAVERVQVSREYGMFSARNLRLGTDTSIARRAFHFARMANFLLSPDMNILQSLLILGHVLQNDGQADATWSLLGATSRLAQSLRLHSPPAQGTSPEQRTRMVKLWLVKYSVMRLS